MTHIKQEGIPTWLWLRDIAERVWTRDWPKPLYFDCPRDWCWRSIVEEDGLSPISARRNGKFSN